MAETQVEDKICEACGADVRSGSLFCYNCGGPVTAEARAMKKNSISGAWLKGDLVDRERYQTTRLDEDQKPAKTPVKTMSEPVAREEVKKPVEPVAKPIEKPVEKPTIAEEAKLKSAANMRRKAKNFQKKTVEVVWEEPENAPNKWFPLVAIVLILLVVGIFYLAMYLR